MIFGKKNKDQTASQESAPQNAMPPSDAGQMGEVGKVGEVGELNANATENAVAPEQDNSSQTTPETAAAQPVAASEISTGKIPDGEIPASEIPAPAAPEAPAQPADSKPADSKQADSKQAGQKQNGPKQGETRSAPDVGPLLVDANAESGRLKPSLALPPFSFTPAGDHGILSRVYKVLSFSPFITLTILVLLQTIFTFDSRELWYSDEIRHGNALQYLLQQGDWLVLQLNGLPYLDKPPLYFWLLAGIQYLLPHAGINAAQAAPAVMFIGVAFSGLLFVWATLAMARWAAGVDRAGRLAAGLVVTGCVFFTGLLHYARMDLFFAALIVLSATLIFRALKQERAMLPMLLGFLCAGLAVLAKGPLGLAFPLVAALLFVCWRGAPLRLLKLDFLLGLLVGLAPALAWLAAIWFSGQEDFVMEIINKQVIGRALDASHHAEPWYHYLVTFPLIWLPWTFLIFFLPWERLFRKQTWQLLRNTRNGERQGLAFMALMFIGGFVMLSLISTKIPIYLLPLFAPLAVLAGRATLQLSPRRVRWMQRVFGVFLILLGVLVFVASMYYAGDFTMLNSQLAALGIPAWPVELQGTLICAGILLLGGCLFIGALRSTRPEGILLTLSVVLAGFSYPFAAITAPSLDPVLSPKGQATVMQEYISKGYHPVTFAMYGGTYSYYTSLPQEELPKDWALLQSRLATENSVVLAMSVTRWDEWRNMPGQSEAAKFTEVDRRWISEKQCVLLVKGDGKQSPPMQEATPPANGQATISPAENAQPVASPAEPLKTEPGQTEPNQIKPGAVEPGKTDAPAEQPAGTGTPAAPEQPAAPAGAGTPVTPVAPAPVAPGGSAIPATPLAPTPGTPGPSGSSDSLAPTGQPAALQPAATQAPAPQPASPPAPVPATGTAPAVPLASSATSPALAPAPAQTVPAQPAPTQPAPAAATSENPAAIQNGQQGLANQPAPATPVQPAPGGSQPGTPPSIQF